MIDSKKIIIFIDKDCLVCNRFTKLLIRFDNKNEFIFSSIQSNFFKRIEKEYGLTPDLDSLVVLENGQVYYYSEAIIKIFLNSNRLLKFLSIILRLLPKFLLNKGYKYFARNRYLFGQLKDCSIIDQIKLKEKIIP